MKNTNKQVTWAMPRLFYTTHRGNSIANKYEERQLNKKHNITCLRSQSLIYEECSYVKMEDKLLYK